jgi:hypothetical protein
MPTYSVDKLIGKQLVMKREVPVYRSIHDNKVIYKTRIGQSAGTVYSWVTNKTTGHIWLMFYDAQKKPYYINTKNLSGSVDTKELQREGVKSTAEVQKEEQKKAAPVEFYLKKYGPIIGAAVVAVIVLKRALR